MKEKKFNPAEHIIKLPKKKKMITGWRVVGGKKLPVETWRTYYQNYLEVKWRLVWFREEHPDWTIKTSLIASNFGEGFQYAAVYCEILDERGRVLSTGHGLEYKSNFANFLEKAETAAVGRALAQLGYGTQFAPELEDKDRVVDTPIETGASDEPSWIRGETEEEIDIEDIAKKINR